MNEWTTNKPTQEGWYWVYELERSGHFRFLAQATRRCGSCPLIIHVGRSKYSVNEFTYFIGPLPEPEFPVTPATKESHD